MAGDGARTANPSLLVTCDAEIDSLLDVPEVERALGKLAGEGERGLAHKGSLLVNEGVEGRRTHRSGAFQSGRAQLVRTALAVDDSNSPAQPLISTNRKFAYVSVDLSINRAPET